MTIYSAAMLVLTAIIAQTLAAADPLVTAAARLAPRAVDSGLVGYISTNGHFTDSRSCDYPQTVSTSGAYVQCCPTTGACPFYTACSSNTLIAASTAVACDATSTLTCNTALVLPTVGAANGGQYLACWQTSLGNSPFTIVQDIGSGSASTTQASSTSSRTGSSSSRTTNSSSGSGSGSTSSRTTQTSTTSSASTSPTTNAGVRDNAGLVNGVLGGAVLLVQALV